MNCTNPVATTGQGQAAAKLRNANLQDATEKQGGGDWKEQGKLGGERCLVGRGLEVPSTHDPHSRVHLGGEGGLLVGVSQVSGVAPRVRGASPHASGVRLVAGHEGSVCTLPVALVCQEHAASLQIQNQCCSRVSSSLKQTTQKIGTPC